MEQPTACRPTRTRSSRQPVSTSEIRDRHALPSRTAHQRRRGHDSGRSAVVSLLGDRSPAVLNHLEHRWIVPDLLGTLVRLLVPAGNHPHYSVVISGQPSLRERSSTEIFVRTGVPPFVRVARRGRNPVHEFVDRCLAAGLFDLIQGRRTHEIRLPGGCVFLMDKLARNALSIIGSRKVGSVASDRQPRAIPARHRRTGDDRGCQRRPRNMAQPGDLPKLADQRLFQNSAPKRAGSQEVRGFKSHRLHETKYLFPTLPSVALAPDDLVYGDGLGKSLEIHVTKRSVRYRGIAVPSRHT